MTDVEKKPRTRTTTIYDKKPNGWRRVRTEEVAIPDPADDGLEASPEFVQTHETAARKVIQAEADRTLAVEHEFCQKVGIDG